MLSYGQVLRAALVVAPHNPWLIKRRSKWLRRRGDAGAALALVDGALSALPPDERLLEERARALGDLAELRWGAGDPQGALPLLDELLAVPSHDERLIRKRAAICARFARQRCRDGDAVGALAFLERALTDVPNHELLLRERSYAVAWLANARRAEGDAARALTLIEEALVHLPDDPGVRAARASTLHTLRRYEEAIDAWRDLMDRAPLDVRGWLGLARALYMLDRSERIDPLIDEYLGALGERPDRYLRAARVALAGRRSARLERLLGDARTHVHRDSGALQELAELHLAVGRVGDALTFLDEALELDRRNESAKTKREDTVRTLRLAGVDAGTLPPLERTALRMPDLALRALVERPLPIATENSGMIAMVYTTLGPGGAERQLTNTVRGLGALPGAPGIVLMPTVDDDPEIHRFHVSSLDALDVPIVPSHGGTVDMARLRGALGSDVADLIALLPFTLRQHVGVLASRFLHQPPAVMHAWSDHRNIPAGVAAALAGIPRIVLSTRTIAPPGTRTVPTYFREVYRALLRRPGVLLVNNSAAGARTYAEWLAVDAKRIGVIYNGIDIDGLESARDPQTTAGHRARLGLPPGARVIGSVFRLGRVKRPLLWLQAASEVARRCPETHFVIVGEGPLRDDMASAAAELGIADRVHMPGLTRDVVPWYDLMDVVLLTSEREGTSNTALEAQALGKPVVSPAVGGMAETFVQGTSGFLVSSDPSPIEIAECVVRALTDTAWRDEAQKTARSFVRERFSIERMVSDTLDLYGFDLVRIARD